MILDQGMYEIITATGSIYELCLGGHSTLRRFPGAKPVHPSVDGTSIQSLRRDAEAIRLLSIEQLEVGLPAEFVLDLRGDGVATYRYTSEVTALSFMGAKLQEF